MDRTSEEAHVLYVLECADGSYYAGYTNRLEHRVKAHNDGRGAKYTRSRRPVRCIFHETFGTKREAMQAEYAFKQLRREQKTAYMDQKGGCDR
ncbi:GIY-YIG nuclease family protein [Edaphobacillus lindanitolerans]|uniref:Putative endonuclease n=1 Tax=Edaphobacillus lindanitolerans TaxID=550447 RepID=A0A1U7PNY6_9BACI|nr:GIY-YIG nuclease family protein [Edaphobacillus lindanitolerans]SIT93410.1 putative endonuclease [Edaphobacillus lindanitolerans]